jgi:N-formylglutamate amidohydrolase
VHALQVEINRALYMHETTFDKSSGFDRIKRDLEGMVRALMASVPEIAVPRAAAE